MFTKLVFIKVRLIFNCIFIFQHVSPFNLSYLFLIVFNRLNDCLVIMNRLIYLYSNLYFFNAVMNVNKDLYFVLQHIFKQNYKNQAYTFQVKFSISGIQTSYPYASIKLFWISSQLILLYRKFDEAYRSSSLWVEFLQSSTDQSISLD